MQLNQLHRNYNILYLVFRSRLTLLALIASLSAADAICIARFLVIAMAMWSVACEGKLGGWNNLNIIYGPLWGRK